MTNENRKVAVGDHVLAVEYSADGDMGDWAEGVVGGFSETLIWFDGDTEGTSQAIYTPERSALTGGRTDIKFFDEPEPTAGGITTTTLGANVVGDATFIPSETGGVKGQKIQRYDLIPADSLDEVATRYGTGFDKYGIDETGVDNWRKGYNWSLSLAAAYRHLTAFMGGEDYDEDSGDKHVTAVAWHMLTLIHYMNDPERYGRFDDRQAKAEQRFANSDKVETELMKVMSPAEYARHRARIDDALKEATA